MNVRIEDKFHAFINICKTPEIVVENTHDSSSPKAIKEKAIKELKANSDI